MQIEWYDEKWAVHMSIVCVVSLHASTATDEPGLKGNRNATGVSGRSVCRYLRDDR